MKFEEGTMNLTHVAVEVLRLRGTDTFTATFLVTIDSVDSVAPASELRKIGVVPVGKRTYQLASGELVEWEYGFVQMRFLGETSTTRIAFGPDNCEPRLGFVALGSAGFHVDLKARTVRKLKARPLMRVA